MRLWSIQPCFLDKAGIGGLWREGLLAQKCLMGLTKGYNNHPQLDRFKICKNPIGAIGSYLMTVALDAERRTYKYDSGKVVLCFHQPIKVTYGQLMYEKKHLLSKLKERKSNNLYDLLYSIDDPDVLVNNTFTVVDGPIEHWERVHG